MARRMGGECGRRGRPGGVLWQLTFFVPIRSRLRALCSWEGRGECPQKFKVSLEPSLAGAVPFQRLSNMWVGGVGGALPATLGSEKAVAGKGGGKALLVAPAPPPSHARLRE